MTTGKPTSKIKLDWSKLLGFDQATRVEGKRYGASPTAPALAKLGGKVGTKVGGKIGFKPGVQIHR